jgi:DNA-binding CsgD family transcriptional regulator
MFPQKSPSVSELESKTYPLGEKIEHASQGPAIALVALSHTPVEQRLYGAMLTAITEGDNPTQTFTARRLMMLSNIRSLSTIRRGLEGLVAKLSIERQDGGLGGNRQPGAAYHVYPPDQIIARRSEMGLGSQTNGIERRQATHYFERAINRVVENNNLSRREAQVALCCVEGLTNAEIGNRLRVTEQTVKFHLRHVFIKFGVKRRAELISRLLM